MAFSKVLYYIGAWTLLTFISQVVSLMRTQEASFQCVKDNNNHLIAQFRIRPNNDTIYQVVGHTAEEIDPDDSTPIASCTTIISGDLEIYQLNVTVNLDTDEISPDCGVQMVSSTKLYKLRFRTQAIEGIRSESDVYYDFTCDSRNSFLESMLLSAFSKGGVQDVRLQPFVPGLTLSLIDYQSNTALYGETDLGREIYYQIGFEKCFQRNIKQTYDTCGNEFMVGFHTFDDQTNSEIVLRIINPSTVSINVYIDNMGTAFPCSPVLIAPKSFGSCTVDSSFKVTDTSNKGIRLLSPYQCVYVHSQYFDSQRFYLQPVFPVDVTGSTYFAMSDNPTEIIALTSSNTTILKGETTDTATETDISSYQTNLFSMVPSFSNASFFLTSNNVSFAVFTKRTLQSRYVIEQLSKESVAGRRFVIPDFNSSYIKCLAHVDDTQITYNGVTESLSERGIPVMFLASTLTTIDANSPVSCRLLHFQTSLALLPIAQWSNNYKFVIDKTKASYNVLLSINAAEKNLLEFKVDGNTHSISSASWSIVADISPEMEGADIPLNLSGISGSVLVTLYHPTVNFQAILKSSHVTSSQISLTNMPGFNAAEINPKQSCRQNLGSVGDLVDNDCDSLVDENTLQGTSSTADIKGIDQGKTCYDKIKVLNCDVSPDPTFNNLTRRIITEGCLPGSPSDPFQPMTPFVYASSFSDDSFKVYTSGKTKLVGFDGYDDVYFRCDVKFCLVSDPSCDQSSCNSRRKREVTEATDELITLDDILKTPTTQGSCFGDTTFIPVLTVLSVISAVLLIIIISIVVRLHLLTSLRSKHLSLSMTKLRSS